MEGIGRVLNPHVNMWRLARPQIEEWVIGNLGPQARLRDGARELLGHLERLPQTLANLEKAAARLAPRRPDAAPDARHNRAAPRRSRRPDGPLRALGHRPPCWPC